MAKLGQTAAGLLPLAGSAAGMALGGPLGGMVGAGLGNVLGGLFDSSDEDAMDELRRNQAIYGNVPLPEFQNYVPDLYTPEAAQATTVQEDPGLRSQQSNYLMRMAGLAEQGLSDVDQAGFERARSLAGQISRGGNAAALQNATARGVGGSGLEFAMREQAAQDAAQRAQDAGLQQAAESARQRAMYQQAYGNALGNVRSQDFTANRANADILNNFNQYNTSATNNARQWNVGNQNSAQQYNNSLRQQQFGNRMDIARGQTGANTGMAQGYAAQNAAGQDMRNAFTDTAFRYGMNAAFPNQKQSDPQQPKPKQQQQGQEGDR